MVTVTPNNHIFIESKLYNSGSQQQVIGELAICFSWESITGCLRDHAVHVSYEASGREKSVLTS